MTRTSQRPLNTLCRSLAAYGALGALWLVPPLLIWPAALAAGGRPGLDLGWPAGAVDALLSGHGLGEPWRWVGCTALPRPPWFWGALAGEFLMVAGVAWAVARQLNAGGSVADDSRWARRWDLRRAGLLVRSAMPGRLALGRSGASFVAARPGVSLLVFGPTGSGKTAGICVPQILEWEGPVVAISVKNDLVMQTAGQRQRMGQTDVYDPTDITGLATCTWSPLRRCEDWDRAMRVGQWLVQGKRGYVSDNAEWEHWEDAAVRLVSCTLYAGAALQRPITEALAWLDDGSGQQLGMALAAIAERDPRALQWYHSVQERPERERGSCYSTSQKALRPYIERSVAASAQDSSFDPRALLTEGSGTLFIVAPQSEQERLSGIFTSLIMTIMTEAADLAQASPTGRLPRPLLVMLDECANTAPIRDLPHYLSTVRSMGITVVAIFQDLSQCEARYKELAGSVINNARAVLFLSGSKDRKTLELLRDLVGRQRRPRYTRDGRGGEQVAFEKEDMLSLDVGRQLQPGRAVLLYEHLPPALLALRSCYHDYDLIQRRVQHTFYPGLGQMVHATAEPPARPATGEPEEFERSWGRPSS